MFNPIKFIREKLNPAQPEIVEDYGDVHLPSANLETIKDAYTKLEVVNRGINLIVDSAADIKMDVGEILDFFETPNRVRKAKLHTLLNFKPNPYYNADVLKRSVLIDLIIEGDAFIYYDGAHLFHLPAISVELITSKVTYIKEYKYGNKTFKPSEIIHIKENSAKSVFVGKSRLDCAIDSMNLLLSMKGFQKNFFDNSAVPGIILTTPNPMSDRVKQRFLSQWVTKYNPNSGGRKPMILDGEFKIEPLSKYSFKELDFNDSIEVQENTVLKALGIPPVLLNSGNNANINPNLRLFYIQTVMPLYNKLVQSLELHFGYDIKAITQEVLALAPELKDLANYLSTLKNSGILTANEARDTIRKPKYTEDTDNDADNLILPANIAGSAVDSTQGGAPSKNKDKNNEV